MQKCQMHTKLWTRDVFVLSFFLLLIFLTIIGGLRVLDAGREKKSYSAQNLFRNAGRSASLIMFE